MNTTGVTQATQADFAASLRGLRESDDALLRVLESSYDCIKTLDLDGRILAMTENSLRGMEVDDFETVRGVAWQSFWDANSCEAASKAVEVARAGGIGRFQGLCPTLKGKPKWWDVTVTPIAGPKGNPEKLLSISRDITRQRQAEERERARILEVFEPGPTFLATLRGPRHIFETTNALYDRLIGNRDVIGKSVAEAIPEAVVRGLVRILDQVYETGETFFAKDLSLTLEPEPGDPPTEILVDFTYQPLRNADGEVSGILVHGVQRDAREKTDRQLRTWWRSS